MPALTPTGRHKPLERQPDCPRVVSDRLRVVYLDHSAELSGAELALLRLLPILVDKIDAHVILAQNGPLADRLVSAGVSTEVLPMAEDARGLARDRIDAPGVPGAILAQTAHYSLAVARRLRRLHPDLVHTNSLKAGVYGGLAARAARVPAVWHLHDRIAHDYLPPAAVRLVRTLIRRLPTAVIANSQTTLNTVVAPGLFAEVIPCPVPIVSPQPPRLGTRTLHLGMVGRLAPWKGQHLFLDAFAKAFPRGGAEATLVGAAMFGDAAYEQTLRDQVTRLALQDRVHMTGFVDDVGRELAAFDLLVHASVIPEPFGQVILEGMAAGLAVAAPRVGGPAEIITNERNGLLYRAGDAEALAQTLIRLATNPVLRAELGAAAQQRARDFAPEVVGLELTRFYHRTLRWARQNGIRPLA